MSLVAERSERAGHHPEWWNVSLFVEKGGGGGGEKGPGREGRGLWRGDRGRGERGRGERGGREGELIRSQVYNKVTIKWTTHSARALTEKDTDMARACDEFAEEMEMGKNP